MPVYNGAKYLSEAIESILQQTFKDFEFIIINDGSTDNSLEIIESYHDERIIIINQENQGLAVSLNNGINITKGKYIARMDQDDISYKERIKTQVDFLNNNPGVIVVGSNADVIDKDGNFVYTRNPNKNNSQLKAGLPYKAPFIHPSIMIHKDSLINVGLYTEYSFLEDIFLYIKLFNLGKFSNIENSLIKYRLSPFAFSRKTKETNKAFKKAIDYFYDHGKLKEYHIESVNKSINQTSKKEKYFQYNLLLAKKYLWNNYQPKLARINVAKAINYKWKCLIPYFLFGLSLLPEGINNILYVLYKKIK